MAKKTNTPEKELVISIVIRQLVSCHPPAPPKYSDDESFCC